MGTKLFLVICQILLVLFLAQEVLSSDMIESLAQRPMAMNCVICRFFCAVVMHITLIDELR